MKLEQTGEWLNSKLSSVETDEDMANLGYECKGRLCEFEGYESFYERLWVCVLRDIENKTYNTAIICDQGNGYCNVAYKDFYIKGLFEEEK